MSIQQCLCFIHYFNHAYIPLTYSLVVAVPDLNMFVPGMCVAPSGDLLTSVELCIKPALLIMGWRWAGSFSQSEVLSYLYLPSSFQLFLVLIFLSSSNWQRNGIRSDR